MTRPFQDLRGHVRWAIRCLGIALLLCACYLTLHSSPAFAAPPPGGLTTEWTTAESTNFRFHVQSADPTAADSMVTGYSPYLEVVLGELDLLFNAPDLTERIVVYAYTDPDAFDAAKIATGRKEIDGQRAIADPITRDISLFLPDLVNDSPREAENQLRHAVTHVMTSLLTGGKMPWGFDEGIAQYVERPVNEKLARTAGLMQTANTRREWISWFDMNRPDSGADAKLATAHSYAVVAFLIERYEIGALRQFMVELNTAPSWRDAMNIAYSRSPDDMEEQWRADLPRWTTGSWRENLVAAFDLQTARRLLEQANYASAKQALEPSQTLFRQLGAPDQLALVEDLIAQCDIGIQAESLMTQVEQALELHTYDRAANLLAQAKLLFAQLPAEQQPTELIAIYEQLANDGQAASGQVDRAIQLAHSWRDYPDARSAALNAGKTYAALGDEEGMARAQTVLDDLDKRQRRIVLVLGALAVLTLAWLALWLWARGPSELEWR